MGERSQASEKRKQKRIKRRKNRQENIDKTYDAAEAGVGILTKVGRVLPVVGSVVNAGVMARDVKNKARNPTDGGKSRTMWDLIKGKSGRKA